MTGNHITSLHIRSVPVLEQDEALEFYTTHLGFEVRDDIDLGFMRWLTVGVPGQNTSLLLELVGGPQHDESTAAQVRGLVTKGALGGLFLLSSDVHATYAALRDAGVEITQEPVEQPYGTDFGSVTRSATTSGSASRVASHRQRSRGPTTRRGPDRQDGQQREQRHDPPGVIDGQLLDPGERVADADPAIEHPAGGGEDRDRRAAAADGRVPGRPRQDVRDRT